VSFFIAIVGLGFLVLVHEAGHFFASLAVGLRPRRFYLGFPPAVIKVKRNGIEYGVGAVPLGGFVSIPGMHRPIPHDAERRFSRAVSEAPSLAPPYDRLRRALEGEDPAAALSALDELDAGMRHNGLSPEAATSAGRGLTDLRDALGPDAYWKAATWRRLIAIAAGPLANVVLAIVLLTVLFMTGSVKPSRTVEAVVADSPAQHVGLRAGDRIVAIDGKPVTGEQIGDRILASKGRALVLTVVRDGRRFDLPSARPILENTGVYRLGIVRKGVGVGPVDAFGRSLKWTGIITREMGTALARLATGEGRKDVSSPIGIVQGSADAVKHGTSNYLWVLSLISLSLALLNLLPLLPLDGGHVLFTIIEGARGRLVKREIYERVSAVGLVLVVLLFFIGLSNDIARLS
jgi:regulator of sigma E protease